MERPPDTAAGIETEIVGHTLILRLNHPPVNALSRALRRRLQEALGEAEQNGTVHAVVLMGGGGMGFSAGADLRESRTITSAALAIETAEMEIAFCEAICRFPKPLIAAIDRYALGGGCELALAADWRIASSRAKLGFPEAKLGAFPAGGAMLLTIGLLGRQRARQLMLRGELFTAAEALELGLVDKVVTHETLLDEALTLACTFEDRSYGSVRAIKALTGEDLGAMRDAVIEWMRTLYSGGDLPEGLRAFLEKRTPQFNRDWVA